MGAPMDTYYRRESFGTNICFFIQLLPLKNPKKQTHTPPKKPSFQNGNPEACARELI